APLGTRYHCTSPCDPIAIAFTPGTRFGTVAAGRRTLLENDKYSSPDCMLKSKSYRSRPNPRGISMNIEPRLSLVVASNGTDSTSAPVANRYPDRPGMEPISMTGGPKVHVNDCGLSLANSHFFPTRA